MKRKCFYADILFKAERVTMTNAENNFFPEMAKPPLLGLDFLEEQDTRNYKEIAKIASKRIDHALEQKQENNKYSDNYRSRRVIESSALIVGVEGVWGSGKTSYTNLLLKELEKKNNNQDKNNIIVFNPWADAYKRHISLTEKFLEILSTVPELKNIQEHSELTESKKKERFSGYRKLMLTPAFYSIVAAFPLAFIIQMITAPNAPDLNIPLNLLSFVTSASFLVALTVLICIDIRNSFLKLQKQRHKFFKSLSKLKRPIIIVIDDLDRLSISEIKEVISFIRTTGNLNNLIYIIPYDSTSLNYSLDGEYYDGEKFFRKILDLNIQVPFKTSLENIEDSIESYPAFDSIQNLKKVDFSKPIFSNFSVSRSYRDMKVFICRVFTTLEDFPNYDMEKILLLEYVYQTEPEVWRRLSNLSTYLFPYNFFNDQDKQDKSPILLNIKELKLIYDSMHFLRKAKKETQTIVSYIFSSVDIFLSKTFDDVEVFYNNEEKNWEKHFFLHQASTNIKDTPIIPFDTIYTLEKYFTRKTSSELERYETLRKNVNLLKKENTFSSNAKEIVDRFHVEDYSSLFSLIKAEKDNFLSKSIEFRMALWNYLYSCYQDEICTSVNLKDFYVRNEMFRIFVYLLRDMRLNESPQVNYLLANANVEQSLMLILAGGSNKNWNKTQFELPEDDEKKLINIFLKSLPFNYVSEQASEITVHFWKMYLEKLEAKQRDEIFKMILEKEKNEEIKIFISFFITTLFVQEQDDKKLEVSEEFKKMDSEDFRKIVQIGLDALDYRDDLQGYSKQKIKDKLEKIIK